jgi:hypothetical protein
MLPCSVCHAHASQPGVARQLLQHSDIAATTFAPARNAHTPDVSRMALLVSMKLRFQFDSKAFLSLYL